MGEPVAHNVRLLFPVTVKATTASTCSCLSPVGPRAPLGASLTCGSNAAPVLLWLCSHLGLLCTCRLSTLHALLEFVLFLWDVYLCLSLSVIAVSRIGFFRGWAVIQRASWWCWPWGFWCSVVCRSIRVFLMAGCRRSWKKVANHQISHRGSGCIDFLGAIGEHRRPHVLLDPAVAAGQCFLL